MNDLRVRPLESDDWPSVREIYAQGIATGQATFETRVPDWQRWNSDHLPSCRLAAVAGPEEQLVGWAALSPVSDRCVYGGVAEVSVYVAQEVRGQGVGTILLRALVAASDEAGLWTLQAGIFPENVASVRIHERCGFRVVGTRERIGKLEGVWRDVVLMERRSPRI